MRLIRTWKWELLTSAPWAPGPERLIVQTSAGGAGAVRGPRQPAQHCTAAAVVREDQLHTWLAGFFLCAPGIVKYLPRQVEGPRHAKVNKEIHATRVFLVRQVIVLSTWSASFHEASTCFKLHSDELSGWRTVIQQLQSEASIFYTHFASIPCWTPFSSKPFVLHSCCKVFFMVGK